MVSFRTIKHILIDLGKWYFKIILSILLVLFLFSKVYNYTEPRSFSGSKIYNPYQAIKPGSWKLGNFHTHSKCWKGLTSGDGDEQEVTELYEFLNYDILALTNYHKPTVTKEGNLLNITGYEHGFGATKTHQLILGNTDVNWLEYPLFHTKNTKQHLLHQLKKKNNLVALPHPHIRKAYTKKDMQQLAYYDCMEAVGQYGDARYLWDEALSAGQPVMIICNDDLHHKNNLPEIGNFATLVQEGATEQDIITALKNGTSIGVNINNLRPKTLLEKKNQLKHLEKLEFLNTKNNKLSLGLSHRAKSIKFIGQNGVTKKIVQNTRETDYKFLPSDSYIRTEIIFDESGNEFYLNPVFRYQNEPFETAHIASINPTKTFLHHSLILLVLSFLHRSWLSLLVQWIRKQIKNIKQKEKEVVVALD